MAAAAMPSSRLDRFRLSPNKLTYRRRPMAAGCGGERRGPDLILIDEYNSRLLERRVNLEQGALRTRKGGSANTAR